MGGVLRSPSKKGEDTERTTFSEEENRVVDTSRLVESAA
jgi:hypothetical protein